MDGRTISIMQPEIVTAPEHLNGVAGFPGEAVDESWRGRLSMLGTARIPSRDGARHYMYRITPSIPFPSLSALCIPEPSN